MLAFIESNDWLIPAVCGQFDELFGELPCPAEPFPVDPPPFVPVEFEATEPDPPATAPEAPPFANCQLQVNVPCVPGVSIAVPRVGMILVSDPLT